LGLTYPSLPLALGACIIGSIISVNIGGNAMQWHAYFGYVILILLIFRIIWGLIGSTHARFANFVPGKVALLNYLSGKSKAVLGHNPLGALSVIGLLAVLLGKTDFFNAKLFLRIYYNVFRS